MNAPRTKTSTRPKVHVVVTCANRKTRPVPEKLQLRHITSTNAARRARTWIGRLESSSIDLVPALDLYAGEHWQVARQLRTTDPRRTTPTLWICSAGYGLVSADAQLRPYAATFAPRHADSVGETVAELTGWWGSLARWPGPQAGAPRRLADLASADPDSTILLALSPAYLRACATDLLDAAEKLTSRDQLSVICLGWSTAEPITDYVLPGNAALQYTLGGTRQALNTRLLAYLLTKHNGPLLRSALRRTATDLLATVGPVRTFNRARQTDKQVTAFIRARLRAKPAASCSLLLREYRDSEHACEQNRFRELYDRTRGTR